MTDRMRFDPEYIAHVLNDNFEDAKTRLLTPLMAIQYAHLVMLASADIVSPADAHKLRDAYAAPRLKRVQHRPQVLANCPGDEGGLSAGHVAIFL